MAYTRLAPELYVHHGAVNVGILCQGHRALLIDYGVGDIWETLRALGIKQVVQVCFTHHHRDQACGILRTPDLDMRIGVPEAEHPWFAKVAAYWDDPANRWHLYDERPHHWMLTTPIPVHETYVDGDIITWGGFRLVVLESPGHTDGHVAYLVETPGGPYLFSGDALYDGGRVWDVYSLQKGWETRDYHGFMGDRKRLLDSLERMLDHDPVALIPSHGKIIREPKQAVEVLRQRLEMCYQQYVAISALRHYFPEMFAAYQDLPEMMPAAPGLSYPDWLSHVGTSWIIRSQDGSCFVVDCGQRGVIRHLQRWQEAGNLGPVEWLWLSHYHDDHVDQIPRFLAAFGCPVVADTHVAQVVGQPLAWRLPCISPARVDVTRVTGHGESWTWREFTLTAYHLPGQTRYHGGLLVKGRGQRLFFAGDSFTMTGIDDYCTGNRNWLGVGRGFDACLALLQSLKPDLIFNCHVDQGFRFTDGQYRFMRENLSAREVSFGELVPWDHANYGLDEHWVRCDPYEQVTRPGQEIEVRVIVTNHSDRSNIATAQPVWPASWAQSPVSAAVEISPHTEDKLTFRFRTPAVTAGRWVIPLDVLYAGRRLPQFREFVLVIKN